VKLSNPFGYGKTSTNLSTSPRKVSHPVSVSLNRRPPTLRYIKKYQIISATNEKNPLNHKPISKLLDRILF
jgi:hypothetical protein